MCKTNLIIFRTKQENQGKHFIINNSLSNRTGDTLQTPLVKKTKHTLEARAGQRVQTRKVNVIGILKLCSRSLTLRLARDTSTGVTVRENEVFKVCNIHRSYSVANFRIRSGKLVCALLWFGEAVHR